MLVLNYKLNMSDLNFHDYFYYDETSPTKLKWKVFRYKGQSHAQLHKQPGDVAGNAGTQDPYYVVSLDYIKYPVHHIVWNMFKGPVPQDKWLDHMDQNSRNNSISNLRLVSRKENARNCAMFKTNKSGVTGVSRKNDPKYPLWRATWVDEFGIKREKNFAILKYGDENAFKMACEYRSLMINELNRMGLGYTQNHGLIKKLEKDSSQSLYASPIRS